MGFPALALFWAYRLPFRGFEPLSFRAALGFKGVGASIKGVGLHLCSPVPRGGNVIREVNVDGTQEEHERS